MYLFEANYLDTFQDKEIKRPIRFDGQFFPDEKERCLYAMSEACDMKEEHEIFLSLDFISC